MTLKCRLGAQIQSQHQLRRKSAAKLFGPAEPQGVAVIFREVKVRLMLNAAQRTGNDGYLGISLSFIILFCFCFFVSQHVTDGLKSFRRQTVSLSEFLKHNKSKQNNTKKTRVSDIAQH